MNEIINVYEYNYNYVLMFMNTIITTYFTVLQEFMEIHGVYKRQ